LHAAPANQNILERIVKRVTDMERASDVRWGNDDRIGFTGMVEPGMKVFLVGPKLVPPLLGLLGVVSFFQLS